jgi:cytoskeletal protein CcmA (bactofilin family)
MMRECLKSISDERGTALITALLLMASLTAIGVFSTNVTTVNQEITGNLKASKRAFYLAEAGMHHAKIFLSQNKGNWNAYGNATPQTLLPATQLATVGTYTVTIQDAGGGGRRVRSIGNTSSNAMTVLESLMRIGSFNPGNAITVGGNLTLSGNPTIEGTNGGVHANGNLSISGSVYISENATATGTYSQSGSPTIGATAAGSQPQVTIPAVDPTVFAASTDYRLAADGNVYDKNGVAQPLDEKKHDWNGWNFSSGTWNLSGNTTINATLYIEGNASISGSPGSATSPWIATIIATGSIQLSGSPVMRPPTQTDPGNLYRSGTENLLFVAGQDVQITGTPNQVLQGIIAAHEQVSLSGNSQVTGFIIADDASNKGTVVVNDAVQGNIDLTYNGGISNPFPGDVEILTWQQL